ncbi:phosphopantetheine-binding protein [Streptomyces sp. NPDC090112]|uniref:phosphopantetheine-binding protein n=1 Tax=Streptomyces sp. NPDC090112 TaxID=3365949 RepID=UPI0038147A16
MGDDDNFFDLGGHSILLQMVRERVVQHTGKDVGIIELFQHPTVRSLARHLDDDRGSGSGNGRRRPAGRVNRLGNRRARLSGNSSDTLGEPGE